MNAVEIRQDIARRLEEICSKVNATLAKGTAIREIEPILTRLGRKGMLPHWYAVLAKDGTLPNLDGKSLGSVLEMLFIAVLEHHFYADSPLVPFRINPARGVDIPTLSLGVKSPSENYCTSEPFFSAYERLVGNDHDAVILLTDYQTQKGTPPLKIQILKSAYLRGSQIADKGLCQIAKRYRDHVFINDETMLQRVVRFLAYVNQSDWEAKVILGLMKCDLTDDSIDKCIRIVRQKFDKDNKQREKDGKELIALSLLEKMQNISDTTPRLNALIDAADGWVIETQKDFGRYPSATELERFKRGALDGVIGMSYALQWRYNFGPLFKAPKAKDPLLTGEEWEA